MPASSSLYNLFVMEICWTFPYDIVMTMTILLFFVNDRQSILSFSGILDLAPALVSGCHTRYGILHCCLSLQLLSAVHLYRLLDVYP
jgi:hypothetical protein